MQKAGLRILIYSDHFYPSIGGSENYALDLATELTRQGHSVGVITAEKEYVVDSFPFKIFRLGKPFSPHRINLNFFEMPGIVKQFRPGVFPFRRSDRTIAEIFSRQVGRSLRPCNG